MQHLEALNHLKGLIEKDLKVAADPYWNGLHLEALGHVEWLLENYL